MNIKVEICTEDVELPFYANDGDAGMDIRSAVDIIIAPQQTVIIPTGLKMAIPKGYELQVRARSGLSLNTPLRISNGIGTIDSGYRNEIGVIMTNTSTKIMSASGDVYNDDYNYSKNSDDSIDAVNSKENYVDYKKNYTIDSKNNKQGSYSIKKGDRIAQIVLNRIPTIEFEKVKNVKTFGKDRNGGFGSTGTK